MSLRPTKFIIYFLPIFFWFGQFENPSTFLIDNRLIIITLVVIEMPKPIRPTIFKERPDISGLFSLEHDPALIYTDLRQIGCGNFGAVYYARNVNTDEIVTSPDNSQLQLTIK